MQDKVHIRVRHPVQKPSRRVNKRQVKALIIRAFTVLGRSCFLLIYCCFAIFCYSFVTRFQGLCVCLPMDYNIQTKAKTTYGYQTQEKSTGKR